jgi:hypothetical protein
MVEAAKAKAVNVPMRVMGHTKPEIMLKPLDIDRHFEADGYLLD